jgi:hypothetical protein
MLDLEPYWKILDICEADFARLEKAGEPGLDEARHAIATLRANIKELQRQDRAKVPEEPPWAKHSQRRQEDAPWIEDGWSGQR